jgi:hypothetical protein
MMCSDKYWANHLPSKINKNQQSNQRANSTGKMSSSESRNCKQKPNAQPAHENGEHEKPRRLKTEPARSVKKQLIGTNHPNDGS